MKVLARGEKGKPLLGVFTALEWLSTEMRRMKIRHETREGVEFKLGRFAAMGLSEKGSLDLCCRVLTAARVFVDAWSAVLRFHHGFVKTIWEAHTFGKKKGAKKTKA